MQRLITKEKGIFCTGGSVGHESLADYNLYRWFDLSALSVDQLEHPIVEFPAARLLAVLKKRLYQKG